MSGQYVPAWQRIKIKQSQQDENGKQTSFEEEDPLNITTHLATGSLTRKEKQRLIRGEQDGGKVTKKKLKSTNRKKEKLAKKVRSEITRKTVLKDQLRYLIDFFLEKSSDHLPEIIKNMDNVKANYSEERLNRTSGNDDNGVVEVWKFSKQKQNWLIKHFFNVDELPIAYNKLVILYFKDLKGEGLKQSISEKCQAKIKEWNAYAQRELDKIKEIVEGKDTAEKETENGKDGEDQDKESGEKKKKDETVEIPPNKEVAERCLELLEAWDSETDLHLISV